MNPKSVNDLDPKLKETYERVMGTSLVTAPTATPKMETQPVLQPETQLVAEPGLQPEQQLQVETPASPTNESTTVSQVFRADSPDKTPKSATVDSPTFKKESATKPGKTNLLMIGIIVGAVVFFAVYGVVWAKLLGLF